MGSIETDEEKNIWFDLHNILSECIKKQTKYPIQVIVKKHIKYNDNKKEDVYDRAIYAVDIDSGLEVRKGLDILDPESSNNLRNEANYYLRMCISDEEKDMILGILNHDPYKPPMHFRKKN